MDGHGHYLGKQFSFTKVFSLSSSLMIHTVFFISNTVEFRLVLYLKIPRFLTSFVTYFVPYFLTKFDGILLTKDSVFKTGGKT